MLAVVVWTQIGPAVAKCYTYQTSKPHYKIADLAISRHLRTALSCEQHTGEEPVEMSLKLNATLLAAIGLNPVQISVENAKAKAKSQHLNSRGKDPYADLPKEDALKVCKQRLQTSFQQADLKVMAFLERVCGS